MRRLEGLTAMAVAGISFHAEAMLRQQWQYVTVDVHPETSGSNDTGYPELWYHKQTLDHFNPQDLRVFAQRYFTNFDHFRPGGPIFLTIGGEGPLTALSVDGHLSNRHFAEELGGCVVSLEHRFYGKSQPFDSLDLDNLEYLTSQQALHDIAQFQKWFTAANNSLTNSRVFCIGGSYPGNLAAWYRLEFPDLTSGCWSASGPLHAQLDWPGFGEMVWKAVATDSAGARDEGIPTKLYAGYEQVAGLIQDATPSSHQKIQEFFNVCPGTLASKDDRDSLEASISTYVGLIMQYNNTAPHHLSAIRDIVIKAESPLHAALNVSRYLNLTVGTGPNNCTDNSIDTMYQQLLNISLPQNGHGNSARAWTWQTCNEFGYFQTATSVYDKPTMYTLGASSRALWQEVCDSVFGIDEATAGTRVAFTNLYYGGKSPRNISRVFFSHGELDAWSLLGITSYPSDGNEVYAEVAALGSHCVGLYSSREGEVPGATAIRNRALALFRQWDAVELPTILFM